ncbi:hypothetical protein WT75_22210 [Burkholderia stagnalis]|uniref:hypothetical protein n=1 Tax=Burkholderia stagnalis TaxID=1503054 RepID=UPI00075FB5B0|nr:hypothetical protein [Burkholderia stagnalis]KWI68273.1 hypothetical protein WT75_22210 [Burkholderia stagnalis]KWN16381.1 hypothetical protein WT84_20180 [Burkholderia stagnalis]KWN35613.1 hypothetical protein WT85_08230 [Burkholderia stagnalis]
MSFDLSGYAAALALILSCYSTWKTIKFNTKQEELIESQRQLNALLAKKEATEQAESRRASVSASFTKLGSSKYRLKIFNQGPATARNVRISFPSGNEFVPDSEVNAKFPMEIMDKYQSVELIAMVHMQSPSKLTVQLDWLDEDGSARSKTVHPTL